MGHATMKCQMLLETIFKKLRNNLFSTLTNTLLDRVKEGVFIVVRVIESFTPDSITRKFEPTGSNFSQETR